MRVEAVPIADLSPAQFAAWDALQRADSCFASPFLRPEYVRIAAQVLSAVEVAVVEDGGELAGFLPFQRVGRSMGRPVGHPLCEVQGMVKRAGLEVDPCELLKGCRLKSLRFDRLLACQSSFAPSHCVTTEAAHLDLVGGFESYRRARRAAGSFALARIAQKTRKLQREIGTPLFEFHTEHPGAFRALVDWKIAQCKRAGVASALSAPWVVELLSLLVRERAAGFSGELSALTAGGRLAAVHFGLRSGGALSWWFPAYNADFARYSPGLILLIEAAKAAPSLGVLRIELGKGDQRFKHSLMSGATPVADGSIDQRWLSHWLWRSWLQTKEAVRSSSLRGPAHRINRVVDQSKLWLRRRDARTRA